MSWHGYLRRLTRSAPLFLTALLLLEPLTSYASEIHLEQIKLPPGFSIELFAKDVPDARSMTLGSKGTLFVGSREEGKVYAVVNGGTPKVKVITIAKGLRQPNGVAFKNGSLFVAEISRVIRFDGIEEHLDNPPKPVLVNGSFPDKAHHGWKFIRFGPDGKLYVPVGAPCNVCESSDPRFASIMRMDPDGKHLELFARGIRNTVGFDWDPVSHELWFTDNGRDWMGDNLPPDELNRAYRPGLHFGFPYWHGRTIQDPEFGSRMKREDFVPPEVELAPHAAALGMRFYTGSMFPDEYRGAIFIAEHGSWNRSKKIGYRISLVRPHAGHDGSYRVFAQGWLQHESAWGRPVDVQVMPDGSLLVSDDRADAIYRISYHRQPHSSEKPAAR
ncbi:MAG TPA: sorbosone dehydrogenase family protein [Geomonas sp.]|nr:sorbosone dehydrogenase family protein [Geomonas sp.]